MRWAEKKFKKQRIFPEKLLNKFSIHAYTSHSSGQMTKLYYKRWIKLAVNNWCILQINYVDWLQKITTALTVANCNLALVSACSIISPWLQIVRGCISQTAFKIRVFNCRCHGYASEKVFVLYLLLHIIVFFFLFFLFFLWGGVSLSFLRTFLTP